MKVLDRIPLWSLFVLSAVLCVLMAHGGHDWGGDFAGYLGQARAVVEGNVGQYTQDQLFCAVHSDLPVGPALYGWGFPLLLAPLYALSGLHLAAFKGLMALFLLASGLVAWFIFGSSMRSSSAKIALALFLFSPALSAFTNQILSDLPFTFFFLVSFLILKKWDEAGFHWKWGLLVGPWIFWTYWIRPNGILLLAPLALWAVFAGFRRQWKRGLRALFPIALFFVCLAAAQLLLPSYRTDSGIWNAYRLSTPWHNLLFYLHEGGEFYQRDVGRYLFWLSLPPLFYAVLIDLRKRWPLILVSTLTVLLYLAWPAIQGIRFLIPLFPIYCFYTVMGLERMARHHEPPRWALWTFATVAILHFTLLYIDLIPRRGPLLHKRVVEGPYTQASMELWKFIDHTPSDAVYSFFKPRVLYLYTRHRAVYNVSPVRTVADYFVVGSPESRVRSGSQPAFDNGRFRVYRLPQEPGTP